jgi:hypothetical protein
MGFKQIDDEKCKSFLKIQNKYVAQRLAMRSPALLDLGERSATSEPHSGSCATLWGTSKMQWDLNKVRTYVFLFFMSGASNFWERVGR